MKLLCPHFFESNTCDVAYQLVGKLVQVSYQGSILSSFITETEAYTQEDPACHAYNGKATPRTLPMFREGGHIYIYFIYGMYFCLNIVTERKGRGCAVLLRGGIPVQGIREQYCNRKLQKPLLSYKKSFWKGFSDGPSKLIMALNVQPCWNNLYIQDSPISIFDLNLNNLHVQQGLRVGIKKGVHLKWRYYVTLSEAYAQVSRNPLLCLDDSN